MASPAINITTSLDAAGIRTAQRELDALKRQVGDVSGGLQTSLAKAGDAMSNFGAKMSTAVTLPVVGVGVAVAKWASDAEENANKVNVVFGDQAAQITAWSKDAESAFGLSEGTAAGFFGSVGTMLQGFGLDAAILPDMSKSIMTLGADLGSFHNLDTAQVMDMISASFRGEYDSIQRLIPSINAAAVETKALSMTGKTSADALSEQEKALATYQLLLEGAGPATGDFARTQDGAANSMRIAQAQIQSAGEQLGAVFLPIVAKVSGMVAEWSQKFTDLDANTKKIIVIVASAAAALGPLVFIGGKLVSVVSGIIGVVKGLSTAMSFLAANPVMLIIAAVVALVAGLVYAYQNFEGFRNVVDTVFSAIAQAAQWLWNTVLKPVWDAIYSFIETTLIPAFQSLWGHIQTAWEFISNAVTWAWNNIIKPVWDAIYWYVENVLIRYIQILWSVYSAVFQGIAAVVSWVWTNILQPIWNAIYAFIETILVPSFQFLWNVVQVVWNGLSAAISFAWGIISGVFDGLRNGIATVASWFGDRIESIKGMFSTIADAISGPFKTAFNFIADAWNNTIGSLSWTVPDWVPIIGGKEISAPKLPTFRSGGMVPGVPGQPVLTLLHGGEQVLRRTEVAGAAPEQPTQRSGDVYVTVNKTDASPYEIGRELLWQMKVAG